MSSTPGDVVSELDRYPIIILRMPKHGSIDSIHRWYDRVEQLLAEAKEPLALIHDFRPVDLLSVNAANRQAIAERVSRIAKSPHVRKIGADARVHANAVIAGAITAVSWLTGSTPWPANNFSNEEAAISWAQVMLGKPSAKNGARY